MYLSQPRAQPSLHSSRKRPEDTRKQRSSFNLINGRKGGFIIFIEIKLFGLYYYWVIIKSNFQIGVRRKVSMSSSEISVKTQNVLTNISNPYDLIRKMKKVISQQMQQIQEYQMAFQSYQREKQILISEKKKMENVSLDLLHKIQVLKNHKTKQKNIETYNLISCKSASYPSIVLQVSPTTKKLQYSSHRPFQKIDPASSHVFDIKDLNSNNLGKKMQETQSTNYEQYVPPPIRLSLKNKNESRLPSMLNNNTTIQNFHKEQTYAENMLQTFLVIGPEIAQFKNKRVAEKQINQLTVSPSALYCSSKYYKQRKDQFIVQICTRAFPEGCKLKKKLISAGEQLNDIIQYKPSHGLSQDYFIFTLKGDERLFKDTIENPNLKKTFLYAANPNYFLFVVCLKLPDFIFVRDQKNYQKKENEVWLCEKIHAIVTYFPIFHVYTEALCKTQSLMSKFITRKVHIDNENIVTWSIAKNVYNLQKNADILQIIQYLGNKKPDYNQVCYHSSYYFGTLPQFGYKTQYSLALYCCPVFFSNFSYEQMLLMLTAIFCQKTLVFLSKVQTIATLSALFLINLISPFQYSEPLLLNCDSLKVRQMIFEFPFAMICSIKKTDQNIQQILQLFAESNTMRSVQDDAQYIVIDVDSNTILYHQVLNRLFGECIVSPGENIKLAYMDVNSCESKSFSLPKALVRENFKPNTRHKTDSEKRKQQIKKSVKQYQQKIASNQTKMPVYRRKEQHQNLLKLLTQYIKQFTFEGENNFQIKSKLQNTHKNLRIQLAKNILMERFKNRTEIIQNFTQSQMFANYLDSTLLN